MFVPLIIGDNFLDYRKDSSYTNIWFYTQRYGFIDSPLLFPMSNFDGVHYLSIAGEEYKVENSRFFPLYPLLIKVVSNFLGGIKAFGVLQFFVALFIANVSFLLSLFVFYKLIRLDFSKKVAFMSLIAILVFPTSFYFASIYSESIFLFLSLCSFYFARKKQWVLAGIFGAALSATRIVGISMFPVLLYEFFSQNKGGKISKAIPLFIAPLGIVAYIIFNFVKWGNGFYFLSTQGLLANGRDVDSIVLPIQTIYRYLKILITVPISQYEWSIALLELITFIFVAILLFISFIKKIRFSYILFALLCFLIPILSGTFSGLPRYVLIMFPVFIVLSLIKKKSLFLVYVVVSIILLFILTMFFSRGYFIA